MCNANLLGNFDENHSVVTVIVQQRHTQVEERLLLLEVAHGRLECQIVGLHDAEAPEIREDPLRELRDLQRSPHTCE